ncbi:suppressor of cytokine signaling 5-like [Glandiceps talaboti]
MASSKKSKSVRRHSDPDEITVEREGIDIEETPTTNTPEKPTSERKSPSLRKKLGLKLNLSSLSSSPKKERKGKDSSIEESSTSVTPKLRRRNKFWMFGFKSKSQSKEETRSREETECCSPCSRTRSFRERLRRRASRENLLSVRSDYAPTPPVRGHQHLQGPGVVFTVNKKPKPPMIDLDSFNPEDYPITDVDEKMREMRAKEMEEGVPVDIPSQPTLDTPVPAPMRKPSTDAMNEQLDRMRCTVPNCCAVRDRLHEADRQRQAQVQQRPESGCIVSDSSVHMVGQYGCLTPNGSYAPRTVHTQIDYIHCLVPDLTSIAKSVFYWGKMDRYEAEKQLESKPEGTFLLRDSAQEEFLFSVSFRRYSRSLHARIEQWNHKFSFDAHDPGVFSADTVCGLLEHYKDPNFCMFFEPMLTIPLPRPNPLPLQHLCRAVICSHIKYDDIKQLCLPSSLREYLREYHYKQKVRVRRFEVDGPTEREVY